MGESGATEAHTAPTAQRATGKEASRSGRSPPGDGPRHDLYPRRVQVSDRSGRSRSRDDLPLHFNLTNSNGNAAIPLSSYGLNVTDQGDVRSICAPCAPCLLFNDLFGGRLAEIFAECGALEKLLRVEAETQFPTFIQNGSPCQSSGGTACLIETTCAGN